MGTTKRLQSRFKSGIDQRACLHSKWSGRRIPKWNEPARTAIILFTSPVESERAEALKVLRHVTEDLHCDDPFLLYLKARTTQLYEGGTGLSRLMEAYEAAANAMQSSGLSRRSEGTIAEPALEHQSEHRGRECGGQIRCRGQEVRRHHDRTCGPAVAEEKDLPRSLLIDIATSILDSQARYGVDREMVLKQLLATYQQAMPDAAPLLTLKGISYINYAFDARGGGYANTVTDDGWKKFAQRLETASDVLQDDFRQDPREAAAAADMISVVLGQQGGDAEAMMWFDRAINSDPTSPCLTT